MDNVRTRFGVIEVSKLHALSPLVLGQRSSPFLQEKLAVLGCKEVYGDVPERIAMLLDIDVSESHVYRTCQNVAKAMDEEALDEPVKEMK